MDTELNLECCNCGSDHRLSAEDFEKEVIQDSGIAFKNREMIKEYECELKDFSIVKKFVERLFERRYKDYSYNPLITSSKRRAKYLFFERMEVSRSIESIKRFSFRSTKNVVSIYDHKDKEFVCGELSIGNKPKLDKDEYFILCPVCDTKNVIEFSKACKIKE